MLPSQSPLRELLGHLHPLRTTPVLPSHTCAHASFPQPELSILLPLNPHHSWKTQVQMPLPPPRGYPHSLSALYWIFPPSTWDSPKTGTSQKEYQELATQNPALTPSNAPQPKRFQVSQYPSFLTPGGGGTKAHPPTCAVITRWKHPSHCSLHRGSN